MSRDSVIIRVPPLQLIDTGTAFLGVSGEYLAVRDGLKARGEPLIEEMQAAGLPLSAAALKQFHVRWAAHLAGVQDILQETGRNHLPVTAHDFEQADHSIP